ncbi:MAG: SPOR domain-containing protein [Alteromonas stellipolaris]|uniref:SPOR domain-containing protein n=1 Tax=Alteromonas stellipolaris TaxID=233316 RepID=UPI003B8B4600
MAQRDYVSRGKAPQKKKPDNKKRGKSQVKSTPTAAFPIVRLAIVVILLIGFAVFLWSIKDNASSEVDTEVVRPVAPTQEALPELPKEEWEYIRTLPGYEVEVDVAEQEKSDKRYLMQCASFRTRAQAEEMKAKIAFQGLEALIRHSSGSNGEWFRVILGPFESKRDAEKAKHSLRKVNIATCQIWFWNL